MSAPERPWTQDYANALLQDLGAAGVAVQSAAIHPAMRWARSGCMALTGERSGTAQMCPVPLAAFADAALHALAALQPCLDHRDGAGYLGERAALAQLERGGAVSANGACRLLPAADGWLAVNLARAQDWELLPAWLEHGSAASWDEVAAGVGRRSVVEATERGRLLGLAVSPMSPPAAAHGTWYREFWRGPPRAVNKRQPRVVDLSSLWAGPLCSHLLQCLGAEVIKVESSHRPDGLRAHPGGFYDLLNAGKASLALDLSRPSERARLRALLASADIIIEGSRPRALRQLGIRAEEVLAENAGSTWLAISGYGREEPADQWIAYGDDAGVAAGLAHIMRECSGAPLFCADAIADPLTGLHAALAGWFSYLHGGGRGIALALHDVVAYGVAFSSPRGVESWRSRAVRWRNLISADDVAAPRAREVARRARELGADTSEVLRALGR
jgi:crotonobetainyl-CoA:carnitine CoA-transferase CaiB-like acyl-CoA transferase